MAQLTQTDATSATAPRDTGATLVVDHLSLYYGETQALADISMATPARQATAFIVPSGCGKSTLLRCFNRMNDLIDNVRITGTIALDGQDIFGKGIDVAQLRRRVGMVFQRPNPFPKSIYENVAYGLRLEGKIPRSGSRAASSSDW